MRPHTLLTRRAAVVLSALLALGHAWPAAAYQAYGIKVGNAVVPVKWSRLPIRYSITDRGVTGVTAAQFRDAAERAFASWEKVAKASLRQPGPNRPGEGRSPALHCEIPRRIS